MITFKDFLLSEAKKYSDMKVKTDKELAADTKKIKQYSDIKLKTNKELTDATKKIKT